MTRRERQILSACLLGQAALATAWWLSLAVSPTVRSWFELLPERKETLNAFLLADVIMFVGGSLVSAWGIWRGRLWGAVLCAFTAGGIAYATLYVAGWVVRSGTAPAGLVPMVAATALTTFVAARTWRHQANT